jgi:hypothetical protein
MFLAIILMVGWFATSVITAFTANVYVSYTFILLFFCSMLQMGISTETKVASKKTITQQAEELKHETKNIPKEKPLNSFKNVFSWIFAIVMFLLIAGVYKVAVWNFFGDGWVKYVVAILFGIANFMIPYTLGIRARKKLPWLKNTLAFG